MKQEKLTYHVYLHLQFNIIPCTQTRTDVSLSHQEAEKQNNGKYCTNYLTLLKCLTSSKIISPNLLILDNETPKALREVIKSYCKMQIIPPDTH